MYTKLVTTYLNADVNLDHNQIIKIQIHHQ